MDSSGLETRGGLLIVCGNSDFITSCVIRILGLGCLHLVHFSPVFLLLHDLHIQSIEMSDNACYQ